jgi:hypothetical protein
MLFPRKQEQLSIVNNQQSIRRGGVVAFGRLLNKPHTYSLRRDPDPADLTVDYRSNLLDIGLELTLGNTGNFTTDAAKIFRLTATGYTLARRRSLTCKETHSGHLKRSCSTEADFSIQFATKHTILGFRRSIARTNPIIMQKKPNLRHFPHNLQKNDGLDGTNPAKTLQIAQTPAKNRTDQAS